MQTTNKYNITHLACGLAVAAAVVVAVGGPSAGAATLTFERSQSLSGWHERAHTGKVWYDLAPDFKHLIAPDVNGDLRGFEQGTTSKWLRSPAFKLDGSGDLTIAGVNGMAGAAPASEVAVPGAKAPGAWAGIALCDVTTGRFVLTKSAPAGMGPVTFTAAELAPHAGRTMTLEVINTAAGGDAFYVNWPIRIPGTLANAARANSLAAIPGDAPRDLVWTKVKLPDCISSHMVLQRDMPVPIWGTAEPNAKISVNIRGQSLATVADAAGKWQVRLAPLKAGGPDRLVVNYIILDDVLVGDVWVGSGQSNMDSKGDEYKSDTVLMRNIAAGPYPKIRLTREAQPWMEATPENLTRYSALLFSFGLCLQQDLDVPIGLIVGAQSGVPSGPFCSPAAFAADRACREATAKAAAKYPQDLKDHELQLAQWEKAVEAAKQNGEPSLPPKPTPPPKPGECFADKMGALYDRYIVPFQPYAIRGVLWDQGESGTCVPGVDQYTMMGALIKGWRKDWGQGDFPFIYVQKPSGGGCAWDKTNPVNALADPFIGIPNGNPPTDGANVGMHVRIMNYPNTAMVISSDLGGETHPQNKSGYGRRAAAVALGMAYGKKVEYYGPLYQSHVIEGGKVRIKFTHVGQGLAFRNGDKLQGFAIAGADKVFHWAEAAIDGATVVVQSAAVPQPSAVWYAWAEDRRWANLFNKDGLPAIPFRTDP